MEWLSRYSSDGDDNLSNLSINSIRIGLDGISDLWDNFIKNNSEQSEPSKNNSEQSEPSEISISSEQRKTKPPTQKLYYCPDCGTDFTTKRRLKSHKTQSKTMICENKRMRRDNEVSLPPHAAIGESFNDCVKKMDDMVKQNCSEEKIRCICQLEAMIFLINYYLFLFRATFIAMSDTDLSKANHEMRSYINAVKKEDKTFHANNAEFYKKNPLFNNLTFTMDDGTVSNYVDYISELDKEDDIKAHMKVLAFLNDQLLYRLRIKSDAAIEVRETMKLIQPHFDNIMRAAAADTL